MSLVLSIAIAWTLLAACWWLLALGLVRHPPPPSEATPDRRWITVFKPLASPLGERELGSLRRCLGSFVADLDERSDLLLGCHPADEAAVRELFEELRQAHPEARLELVVFSQLAGHPNRKVSSMQALAAHARGELWMWSDSDIVAPPGTLASLRRDLGEPGTRFVTSPYVVVDVGSAPALLDTLFVNVEFYPGAALLGRLDQVRFGFGSAMLFEAATFRERLDWDRLGSRLAEDYLLGQVLGPSRLGSTRLSTLASSSDWRGALLHYLRWQKTIRWVRPGSFAAQVIVIPVLGWLALVASAPAQPWSWLGLGLTLIGEAGVAWGLCRAVGCRLRPAHWSVLPLWSLLRALTWLACWLPWPIVWRGQRWWSPIRHDRLRQPVVDTEPSFR